MGTLLQEFGHDTVLLHFIDRVLKKRVNELFYIVSPAIGPKIDIHFWNSEKNEYTSAYGMSRPEYIPVLYERKNYSKEIFDRMNKESRYLGQRWYRELSRQLNRDLKEFVKEYCNNVEKITGDLPDVMGFDKNGKETLWAELKFEGFGKKARETVLRQFRLSKERGITFLLVIPKIPLYSREIKDNWINNNFPKEITVYKFDNDIQTVLPKRSKIQFIEVGRE
ncbi:MAG: hypothetical protein KAW56_00340 [Candidatus Marinimicrobia bacterium]|nr:hypothetical protein [Candidatus Neomarinimicrobiota bacterium]MCK4445508.1 hypothetical protein [Candidatus Neomarinimicrobiota bacterium]